MREIGLNKRATDLRNQSRRRKRATRPVDSQRDAGLVSAEGSGLARATLFRAKSGVGEAEGGTDSGISADDRKEIQNEIDKIARRNRISNRPEDFVVRPRKKGFVFPLTVNALALVATAAAVVVLSLVFRQRDIAIASSSYSLDTAEGKLLQELKRDSDSKLQEKDKAITDIQNRLSSLDKERNDLAANIDQKVKAKEDELRATLLAELDAEKKRLADQGISATALQARIKTYETERTAVFNKAIADAKKAADAEKAAAETRFTQLESEYQKSILGLGVERKRILDDAKSREDALRTSLEAKTKELESQSANATAGLERARTELANLEAQKNQAKADEDRVLGLYGTIRSALRDRRFSDAADGSAALVSYLQDPSRGSDPTTQGRRDADVFVAETLGIYARSELDRASADATKLLAQADLLSQAREAAAAAQDALKNGDTGLAAAKYAEALGKVPEILAAHQYFIDQLQAAETLRQSRLTDALAAADRAFSSGDKSAAAARYSEALAYLPLSDSARSALISRLGSFAADDAAKGKKAADTKAADAPYRAARARLDANDYAAAITAYIGLLASYPNADQAGDSLKGIETARAGMQTLIDGVAASSTAGSAAALKQLADARSEAAANETRLQSEIDTLKKALADAQKQTATAAVAADPSVAAAGQAAQAGEIAALKQEVQRLTDETANTKTLADKFTALSASYQKYLETESEAVKKGGQPSSLAAQSSLYSFLGEGSVAETLPGLRDKVAAFQGASQSELMDAFPSDASEIVQQALTYKDKAALKTYYASRRQVYAKSSNTLMVNFIDAVAKVLN